MTNVLHILVADYVPIANKGEEAIMRGIEDMLSDSRPVALGLFGNVAEVTQQGDITIFPKDWIFRVEGNADLSGWSRILVQAVIALELRLGIYSRLKNFTQAGDAKCRALQDFFDRAEYVLVGHDGVFCVESCGIIHLAKKHGKRTGILGASTGIGAGRFYKAALYRRALEESDFCVFRERHSCESMKQVCRDPEKLIVGPDPAFAMDPVSSDEATEILGQYEPYCRARYASRPVVAVTVLEKGRVYAGFRPDLQGQEKRLAHARYVATVLDTLIIKSGAFVVFLPHSVEDDGSDIAAAQHVTEQMEAKPNDAMTLEEDCGPRLLKGIIGACDFVVGERTHSLIGSVSVGTPFVALTNRRDTRTHGIIGEMCRCEHQIVDMDVTDEGAAAQRALELLESRASIRESLSQVNQALSKQLRQIARLVRNVPESCPGR
ncbi:MAG: polysaccharide pyruvyl transferase family protein [Phycisphaerales bacterium]|nr:MAG: polysaccharide pyruvyl transferase family protein [Phycisphaerales bacterium]